MPRTPLRDSRCHEKGAGCAKSHRGTRTQQDRWRQRARTREGEREALRVVRGGEDKAADTGSFTPMFPVCPLSQHKEDSSWEGERGALCCRKQIVSKLCRLYKVVLTSAYQGLSRKENLEKWKQRTAWGPWRCGGHPPTRFVPLIRQMRSSSRVKSGTLAPGVGLGPQQAARPVGEETRVGPGKEAASS